MNIVERNYYKRDRKKYEVKNNEDFLKWYYLSIQNGAKLSYHINLEDFQMLIDTLTNWYQLKYPDYLLEPYPNNPWGERLRTMNHSNIGVEEMLIRLPLKQLIIMDCEYGMTGNASGNYREIENGRKVAKCWIGFNLYDKEDDRKNYPILVEPDTGRIIDSRITSFVNQNIETIYQYLKENPSRFDYHELENVIENNHFLIELRHRLLKLTALKILYASNTPEMGYKRAKKFIEEMNSELGLLLDTKEIDAIYQNYGRIKNPEMIRYHQKVIIPKGEKTLVRKQRKVLRES